MAREDTLRRGVEASFRGAFRNIELFLVKIARDLQEKNGIFERNVFNMTRMDKTLRSLRVSMNALGFRAAIRKQLEALVLMLDDILAEAKRLDLPDSFTKESQFAIRMLMVGSERQLTQVGNKAADQLGMVLRQSVLNGGDFKQLIVQIADLNRINERQAIQLAEESIRAFSSSVKVQHAKEHGVKWFVYKGPDDGKTREWCDHWVGRRGTLEMFNETQDEFGRQDQPNPVEFWRGGHRCRHRLQPLPQSKIKNWPVGARDFRHSSFASKSSRVVDADDTNVAPSG